MGRFQDRNVGQVAIPAIVIESVTDHEMVGDPGTDPVGLDVNLPPDRLVQKNARLDGRGP